jgi:hypothetical protein
MVATQPGALSVAFVAVFGLIAAAVPVGLVWTRGILRPQANLLTAANRSSVAWANSMSYFERQFLSHTGGAPGRKGRLKWNSFLILSRSNLAFITLAKTSNQ